MALIATTLPTDFADHIAKNAGVILKEFDTSAWSVSRDNIIGATSGGISFADTPEYVDFGEDIDNCPKNTKELKEISGREIKLSGTFVSVNEELLQKLIGNGSLASHTITPSDEISDNDFQKLWLVVDYGDGEAIAIEMENMLNTGGFQIQTNDKAKGTFSFEFTAHYSMADLKVPYKVHFKAA